MKERIEFLGCFGRAGSVRQSAGGRSDISGRDRLPRPVHDALQGSVHHGLDANLQGFTLFYSWLLAEDLHFLRGEGVLGSLGTACSNKDYCSPVLCLESEAKNPFPLISRILRLALEGLGSMHILCSRAYSGTIASIKNKHSSIAYREITQHE